MDHAANPLARPEFPLSSRYDPGWVMEHQMGPNALWLAEWLCAAMRLEPGMRVLDLGCGSCLTSIFLARELQVRVWAADLWVDPSANWARVREMGVEDRVTPLQVEAHALPFAEGFFDAVVSVDAYHYFGTDDLYLGYLARFVRTDGQLGVVVPGLARPLPSTGPPPHLTEPQANGTPFWEDECASFHTASWWRDLWTAANRVTVEIADAMERGWELWRDFELALETAGKNAFPSVAEALERDAGQYLTFVRLVARRGGRAGLNLYQPGLVQLLEGRPAEGA
jgi:SAM-dependent methyltransferase